MFALDWRSALEVAGAMIESRAFHFNTTEGASGNFGFQFQNNSTSTFANELKFAAAKSVRTSIVTLASFNILAALLTALGICWDSYKAIKKREGQFNLRSSFFKIIGPADTFPFILCLGIIVQGIIFAYAQSRGFESLSILNCMHISQAMLPAMFITLFIQLVLGMEMAIRAAMPRPFPVRARWVLPFCLFLIGLLLLATVLVTIFARPPNFCFASLFWLVHRWKLGILISLCLILGFLLVAVAIIAIRLRSNAKVDDVERLAAYRMVFYLAISIASLACILPFFIQSMLMDLITQAYELSKYGMVASVVANLSGIITFGCFVFLRTKKVRGVDSGVSFNPGKEVDYDQEKDPRTQSVNSDDRWLSQIQQPLTPPHYNGSIPPQPAVRSEDSAPRSVYEGRNIPQSSTSLASKSLPQVPTQEQGVATQIPNIHIRKSSSGAAPQLQEQQPATPRWVLPAATYEPMLSPTSGMGMGSLVPPPKIRSPDGISHRRGTSLESMATVQIGLRLSNVNDIPALEQSYRADREQIHSLNYSNVQGFRDSRRPSFAGDLNVAGDRSTDYRASVMSVIISQSDDSSTIGNEEIRLSPTVYNPKKPVARQSEASATSRYDDDDNDAVPDPLFSSRKGSGWI